MIFGHHKGAPTAEPEARVAGPIIVRTGFWRNITLVYLGGIYSPLLAQKLARRHIS